MISVELWWVFVTFSNFVPIHMIWWAIQKLYRIFYEFQKYLLVFLHLFVFQLNFIHLSIFLWIWAYDCSFFFVVQIVVFILNVHLLSFLDQDVFILFRNFWFTLSYFKNIWCPLIFCFFQLYCLTLMILQIVLVIYFLQVIWIINWLLNFSFKSWPPIFSKNEIINLINGNNSLFGMLGSFLKWRL